MSDVMKLPKTSKTLEAAVKDQCRMKDDSSGSVQRDPKNKLFMKRYISQNSMISQKSHASNPKVFLGMHSNQKKHHKGPIDINFKESRVDRSKTKLIRRKTLFKKVTFF